jgi:hypothetical protein
MSGLFEYLKDYSSGRFPLPSSIKNDLVGEKDADITCDIRNYINIIDDFVNTYEYDISVKRLNSHGELKGSTDSPATIVPYSILVNNLLNDKRTHTPEEKKKIMNNLFVLDEDDKIDKIYPSNVVRPINLDIIDVLFNETFFDDLQKNTKKNYTPEEKEALKACLKVELKGINDNLTTSKRTESKPIEFVPDLDYFVSSLTGANGVIAILIKELGDRMKRKLMIHQQRYQTPVKKNTNEKELNRQH